MCCVTLKSLLNFFFFTRADNGTHFHLLLLSIFGRGLSPLLWWRWQKGFHSHAMVEEDTKFAKALAQNSNFQKCQTFPHRNKRKLLWRDSKHSANPFHFAIYERLFGRSRMFVYLIIWPTYENAASAAAAQSCEEDERGLTKKKREKKTG